MTNPDGRRGINMIVVGTGVADIADRAMVGNWGGLRDKYLPASWRGRAHFHPFNEGGGGQSESPGTSGSSGIDSGWPAAVHELGHQLGLEHEGIGFQSQSPLHASLMNYAYSYSFDGRADAIRFSNGRFASIKMTEQDRQPGTNGLHADAIRSRHESGCASSLVVHDVSGQPRARAHADLCRRVADALLLESIHARRVVRGRHVARRRDSPERVIAGVK